MTDGNNKKKILFVDDEIQVLDGLRDALRKQRQNWDMFFESSPVEALKRVENEPFDVVVSDMRMPVMDGATLLAEVRRLQPSGVRMVLSGFSELEVAMRAVSVAHQFMTKPCPADHLVHVIARACALRDLLHDDQLKVTIGHLQRLPPAPGMFEKVTIAMSDPHASATSIARIIEEDPAMSAKVIHLANSGFFRLARAVESVEAAITYLGYNVTKSLVLSSEIFGKSLSDGPSEGLLKRVQEHSALTAHLAMSLASDKRMREEAFLSAIVHDIGKVVLAMADPEYEATMKRELKANPQEEHKLEKQLWGVSHAEVGAYLLGIWGVAYNVVEAVAYHHDPAAMSAHGMDTVTCLQLANAVAHEQNSKWLQKGACGPAVEELALERGLGNELKRLRETAVAANKNATARRA